MLKLLLFVCTVLASLSSYAQIGPCLQRAQTAHDIALSLNAGTPPENINAMFSPAPTTQEELAKREAWWQSLKEEVIAELQRVGKVSQAEARVAQSVLERCAQDYGKHPTASSERFLAGSMDKRFYECRGKLQDHAVITHLRQQRNMSRDAVVGQLNGALEETKRQQLIDLIDDSFKESDAGAWFSKHLRTCMAEVI